MRGPEVFLWAHQRLQKNRRPEGVFAGVISSTNAALSIFQSNFKASSPRHKASELNLFLTTSVFFESIIRAKIHRDCEIEVLLGLYGIFGSWSKLI